GAARDIFVEAMQAAKSAGAVVSFDLNFRAKLWKLRGGEEHARKVLVRILKHVDVLVGNEEDLQKGVGVSGPDAVATSKLDPRTFLETIEKVVEKYPH